MDSKIVTVGQDIQSPENVNDLYELLGVERDCSEESLQRAYRKMSQRFHPDKNGDSAIFTKIQNAYKILSNEKDRKFYDDTHMIPPTELDLKQRAGRMAMQKIENVCNEMISNFAEHLLAINSPIDLSIKSLNVDLENYKKASVQAIKHKKNFDNVLRRFRKTKNFDKTILGCQLELRYRELSKKIALLEIDTELVKSAIAIVRKYDYELDANLMAQSMYGTPTTVTTIP